MSVSQSASSGSRPAPAANLFCFLSMAIWATGFPSAEVLLESWDAISLVAVRQAFGVIALLMIWGMLEGWKSVFNSPWYRGIQVGGIGFGIGSILFLVGQELSDPVTPAIAAAMMPIFGAILEVIFDDRRLNGRLVIAIAFGLFGGYLATGVRLMDGSFGLGALLCLVSVVLFAWGSRATAMEFAKTSSLGKTTLTLVGALVLAVGAYLLALVTGLGGVKLGVMDSKNFLLFLNYSLGSLALAQLFWIIGVSGMGIFLASFHMNAVPFYVMITVVLFLDAQWDWMQAAGAALVAIGVMISQYQPKESVPG